MSKVAAIQMASGPNVKANLAEAEKLIKIAVQQEAELVVLPENFAIMGMAETDKVKIAEDLGSGLLQDFLKAQAMKYNIWLVGGTIPLRSEEAGKAYASCLLINPQGELVGRYDKIHLFDVTIEASDESYTESETVSAGKDILVVDTPFGRLGLAVCYDLRFPELFRAMVEQKMEICALPSAFTSLTGRVHWESLLRSRAIENLTFMIAADQGGYHVGGRETHGDSMIVDPWGQVLNRLPHGTGVVVADIDISKLEHTRKMFPALEHKRFQCGLVPH
ncbi:MAG: carbon-nitrogen hydrolase family protein [Gammaproteobacteria bacterium]|nr:carbon-nitrogen hydrolase family protein [Gammaproteobacteria bacterium]NNJ50578.1 carbon-nitrogen hydrolase family protein [Gammaproteobacteria bacterium]